MLVIPSPNIQVPHPVVLNIPNKLMDLNFLWFLQGFTGTMCKGCIGVLWGYMWLPLLDDDIFREENWANSLKNRLISGSVR